ncbi:hypothetical protein [Flavobacterium beibuense]|uniref:Uncharacterized protein n=1 Tax=Flavobacterium beibuense TaxID=657326 RepID=A0A444WGM4_9FLAO|nr:hypothetical protein [Flavobacterium beibuense]RYJ44947.1 hypothetical protein NU09_0581 [Flavobacterium beibuense]
MSKSEEYNIKFYKITIDGGRIRYIFDTNEAIGICKNLSFIFFLHRNEIEALIWEINSIQQNEPYDHDFLEQSEIYGIFEVTFSNPEFYVSG